MFGGPLVTEPVIIPRVEREQLADALRGFVGSVPHEGPAVALEVREGNTIEEILAKANTLPADMIVMGTHGRGGFDRLCLGSVAEKVLRKASCPVLTVPPRATHATAAPVFHRILCAVDFSESSLRALHYAIALAQKTGGRMSAVHVFELRPEAEDGDLPVFCDYHEQLKATARQRLAAAIPAGARDCCDIEEIVIASKAYRGILALVEQRRADLIVMGVRGRGAADLLMFGSTTQHVVRQAACPVLTLRTG